jgi:hypothetical protein
LIVCIVSHITVIVDADEKEKTFVNDDAIAGIGW